jgi:hypothetical protein
MLDIVCNIVPVAPHHQGENFGPLLTQARTEKGFRVQFSELHLAVFPVCHPSAALWKLGSKIRNSQTSCCITM